MCAGFHGCTMPPDWSPTSGLVTRPPHTHSSLPAPVLRLQDAADALHLLTVQRQLHERMSGLSLGLRHTPSPQQPPATGASSVNGTNGGDGAVPAWQAHGRAVQQQYKGRKARVQLVGRQAPLNFGSFSSSNSCMYAAAHGTATFCDYCVPR